LVKDNRKGASPKVYALTYFFKEYILLQGATSMGEDRKEEVLLGTWSVEGIDRLLRRANAITEPSGRIAFLSGAFLGLPYRESTLIGSASQQERLVIDFEGMDCFTFIDNIEAMSRSSSFEQFKEQLILVRYRAGQVDFFSRHHFFTDWCPSGIAKDVTRQLALREALTVTKVLNRKSDGSVFVPGIEPIPRPITYVPTESIDDAILGRFETGDYVGIYAETDGLDVSHVGMIIRNDDTILFRHASSIERKVLDQDFRVYVAEKPGIIVLRSTASK
jgi:hypothetical protein